MPLCYSRLCSSFHNQWWIQNGLTARKRPKSIIFGHVTLNFDRWHWQNNRAPPLLSHIKLCASFRRHMWIKTGVTVRKRLNWVLTSVTLTFDFWPCPFAWASFQSVVISRKKIKMIRWWEHSEKVWQTDRRTGRSVLRAAWLQLKNIKGLHHCPTATVKTFEGYVAIIYMHCVLMADCYIKCDHLLSY